MEKFKLKVFILSVTAGNSVSVKQREVQVCEDQQQSDHKPFKPSRCIKASFYIPENRLGFSYN